MGYSRRQVLYCSFRPLLIVCVLLIEVISYLHLLYFTDTIALKLAVCCND